MTLDNFPLVIQEKVKVARSMLKSHVQLESSSLLVLSTFQSELTYILLYTAVCFVQISTVAKRGERSDPYLHDVHMPQEWQLALELDPIPAVL